MALFPRVCLCVCFHSSPLFLKALEQFFTCTRLCAGPSVFAGAMFKMKKTCHLMFSRKDAIYVENLCVSENSVNVGQQCTWKRLKIRSLIVCFDNKLKLAAHFVRSLFFSCQVLLCCGLCFAHIWPLEDIICAKSKNVKRFSFPPTVQCLFFLLEAGKWYSFEPNVFFLIVTSRLGDFFYLFIYLHCMNNNVALGLCTLRK